MEPLEGRIKLSPGIDHAGPFEILEPQDLEIGEFFEVQVRFATDFEAPIL